MNFSNINEEFIINSILYYFEDLNKEINSFNSIEKRVEINEKFYIFNSINILTNIILKITMNILNRIVNQFSVEKKNEFYSFIKSEKKFGFIFEKIISNLNIIKKGNIDQNHFIHNLSEYLKIEPNDISDLNLNELINYDFLKYITFDSLEEYLKNPNLSYSLFDTVTYKRLIKNIYYYVKIKKKYLIFIK